MHNEGVNIAMCRVSECGGQRAHDVKTRSCARRRQNPVSSRSCRPRGSCAHWSMALEDCSLHWFVYWRRRRLCASRADARCPSRTESHHCRAGCRYARCDRIDRIPGPGCARRRVRVHRRTNHVVNRFRYQLWPHCRRRSCGLRDRCAQPDIGAALTARCDTGTALALSGHASAVALQWLMRPMVFLHTTTIAAWIGAHSAWPRAPRGRCCGDSGATTFFQLIPYAVAMLIAAGLVLAIVQVEHPRALIDTAYGQVFLVKFTLLVGLFTLAALNRWSLTAPTKAGGAGTARRLVRSTAVETTIALMIFGAVAGWRFTPPPRALAAAAAQPATVHIHMAKAMADLAVTPGRAGPVTVSAFIMTGDFGRSTRRKSHSCSPIRLPGSRRSSAAPKDIRRDLACRGGRAPLAGQWILRIDVLISDFDLAKLEGRIAIRS